MSRLLRRREEELEEHDISKELFLGIMMLMLCLGIMVLNATQPVWRVHRHDPKPGDVVVLYTREGLGISEDGYVISRTLNEHSFRRMVRGLVTDPSTDLHLFLKGGSRDQVTRHVFYADSLLSEDLAGQKVRPAVFLHSW